MLKMAVIGAGRAGRARMRAIDAHADVELGGVVSSQADTRTDTLEGLLARDDVDAVCVSTINSLHAPLVRQALEAGKHVVCEYPLALSAGEGRALFDLARARDRVLHVEHIELLSGSQQALRRAHDDLGRARPSGGVYRSQANSDGWIASRELGGFPSFSGISRLHRLVDLFGRARVASATFEERDEVQALLVDLEFEEGGECRLDYRRGRALARRESWAIRCDGGAELGTAPPLPTAPLFAQDLDVFVGRVTDGASSYVSDDRVLEVLDLAESIREQCEG